LVYDGRRLVGFNTDATGGYAALSRALADQGLAAKGLNVAIVGTGGTARALGYAVRSAGASVLVAGRSEERGRALVRALSGRFVKVSDLARRRYDVLVNCTPVGMATNGHPSPGELPVSPSAIKGKLVYDVVYAPMETALLKAARARGIPTLGGIEMLVEQAAEQYQLFSGRLAPIDMMREAVRQELHQNRRIG
ncbi:MAG: shikimate dehydrogenase family protein, partial [Acidobacteriota bacterium]